ncbi:MAG: toll/interleukin-1 receptor domain-containing protein [Erysipelotrichaceae bacterium]|nr:toll/interleukin-1 receptor domain-containing protein [Erysipelotrichaceae bacterium]MCH4043995.1 toll/interleukin-1 receptor domain-containing protein [Erysipelotrichaceae bacterium]MCH4121210.1 toll/interleukin-1 receptor domain-containing protein [Erysipelotrichaceae bacterium]
MSDAYDQHPKVFISYSHQSEDYQKQVLDFSNRLRADGIDAEIDQYEEAPSEGWPRWMENKLRWADYVIILMSKSYYDRFYDPNLGKGVHWEVNIIYNQLYSNNSKTNKFIPAFFESNDEKYILEPLRGFTYYNIEEDYHKLYNRLRGFSSVEKPPLGKLKPLNEKKPKTMFFTTPINLDKWNHAGWKGALYALQGGVIPVLGLVFKHYDVGVEIFKEWRRNWGTGFVDEFLSINYVVPPFPKNCYVYKNKENSFGKGYFISIGPNMDAAIKRAEDRGIKPDGLMLTALSRNIWVNEVHGSSFREEFTKMQDEVGYYALVPVSITDITKPIDESNVRIGFDYAIKLHNFNVKKGIELDYNDPSKAVLDPPVSMGC